MSWSNLAEVQGKEFTAAEMVEKLNGVSDMMTNN